ncbi:hypothetical protein F5884DRAFT_905663 [Xylogone sp. PMI_703]|nr:hypothetical protein F5884DRAFT_905663 [Xylogone sp. PMI_703]
MKFAQIALSIGLFAVSAMGATTSSNTVTQAEIAKRGDTAHCQNPGANMCAVLALAGGTGTVFGLNGGSTVAVVNGDCNNIVASDPSSGSFNGDYQLVFGTTLNFHADFIDVDDISGISFTYQGQTFNQGGCSGRQDDSGTTSVTVEQCNFPC